MQMDSDNDAVGIWHEGSGHLGPVKPFEKFAFYKQATLKIQYISMDLMSI